MAFKHTCSVCRQQLITSYLVVSFLKHVMLKHTSCMEGSEVPVYYNIGLTLPAVKKKTQLVNNPKYCNFFSISFQSSKICLFVKPISIFLKNVRGQQSTQSLKTSGEGFFFSFLNHQLHHKHCTSSFSHVLHDLGSQKQHAVGR